MSSKDWRTCLPRSQYSFHLDIKDTSYNTLLKILNETCLENLTSSIWPPTISSSLMKNFHLRDKTSRPSTLLSNPKTWCIVAQVFSDHGSTLNPLSTLHNLKVDCAHLRSSTMIVPEFNDTKGEVFGEINLEVEIGRPYSRSFKTWSWM